MFDVTNPANMTQVEVTDADRTQRDQAVKSAVLPAYKKQCGESCAQIWNKTIGAKLGFVIQ